MKLPRRRAALLISAALLAGALVLFALILVPGERRRALESWRARLEASAHDRQELVASWVASRLGDARIVAEFPSVRAQAGAAETNAPSLDPGHLRPILTEFVRARDLEALYVLDNAGRVIVATSGAPATPPKAVDDRLMYGVNDAGEPRALFSSPIRENDRELGRVLISEDPRRQLFPRLRREAAPTRTGETFLIGRAPQGPLLLSPLRASSPQLPSPLGPVPGPDAAGSPVASARYRDGSQAEVLGSMIDVPDTPWSVVTSIHVREALAGTNERLAALGMTLLAFVVALAGIGTVLVRERHARDLREANVRLEEAVRARTEELVAANRELEAFAFSVSHDLRAPLRAIDGFARMLEEDHAGALGGEGRRLLGVVRQNARRMGQLIDDLLAFSRAGRRAMAFARVDMAAIARSVFAEQTPPEQRAGIEFTVDALPDALADPSLVRQVWANLIGNAAKFCSRRASARIRVGGRADGDTLTYWVADDGEGFDMRYSDKLFNVFQRLHSTSEFEGTGVGLAIVRRIVERHGGRTWAEGEVGRGATFYFSLPAVRHDAPAGAGQA